VSARIVIAEWLWDGAWLPDGALYVVDWCVTRAASARIDDWVKAGGVAYLSAGAATRDEYYSPYVPPFAAPVWGIDAADAVRCGLPATGTGGVGGCPRGRRVLAHL